MSKFFKTLALSACLASFAFAQDDDYENSYSSAEESSYEEESSNESEAYAESAPYSKKAAVQDDDEEETSSENIKWFIDVHPITTLILTLAGQPSIYATVENIFNDNMSLLIRPYFLYASAEDDDAEVSIWELGLYGGARWYFNPGHRGFYGDALLTLMYAGGHAEDRYESADVSVFGIGVLGLVGWKYVSGNFNFGIDLGLGYTIAVGSGSDNNEVQDLSTAGVVLDLNIYVGLGF